MRGRRGRLAVILGCRRAASAVEFGLIAPVLVLLVAGMVDIAGAMQQAVRVESAARAAAQYAMMFPEDTSRIVAAAQDALDPPGSGTVAVTPAFCACPGGSTALVACEGTPCAGSPAGVYVSITVSRPYAAILGIGRFAVPTTLTGTAVARVR